MKLMHFSLILFTPALACVSTQAYAEKPLLTSQDVYKFEVAGRSVYSAPHVLERRRLKLSLHERVAGLWMVWGRVASAAVLHSRCVAGAHPLAPFLLKVLAISVVFAWSVIRTEGSVVAALLLHTGMNLWPSLIPLLPTGEGHRPYGLLVTILVLVALGLLVQSKVAVSRELQAR